MTLNAQFRFSLERGYSARAILSVVVVALLVPALSIAGWVARVSADAERAQIEQNVQQRTQEISTILDREILGLKGMLTALATSSALSSEDLRGFHDKAFEIAQQLGVQIVLYDVERNEQVVNTQVPFGASLEGRSYPRPLVERAFTLPGPFVTGVLVGTITRRPMIGVVIPVRTGVNKRYLLAAAVPASQIASVFDLTKLQPSYVATIVDRNGLIVARSSKHDQFVGQPIPGALTPPEPGASGTHASPNVEGVAFRWFYSRSRVSDWVILVGAPEDLLNRPLRLVSLVLGIAAVLLFMLGLTLAYTVGGRFSRAASRAQEEERLRLAHELHDQTGQSLTAALMELKQIAATVDDRGSVHLKRLREQLEDMGKTVHRIATELRPAAIEQLGLRRAIGAHLADWSATHGIATDFHFHAADDAPTHLPLEIETAFYRIAQEALTNIAKHADGVTAVSVVVSCSSTLLQMTIEDNGRGFDAGGAGKTSSGLGLVGMRERALRIGGSFDAESSRRSGTTIFVRVPLEQRRQVA